MAGEAPLVLLEEVTDMLSGGTPSKAQPDYWGGDIPWVSAKDMKERRLRDAEDHITLMGLANGSKLAPTSATLVLTRGMTLLTDVPICALDRDVAFNQDVKAIVPRDEIEPLYLSYALRAAKPELLSMVELAGHGTGRLPTDRLKALKIPFPYKAEQRAIAHILGTLDDKIELNRRMNEILEAMARALFQSWFVDFDPVRAKAEGRDPSLPSDIAGLFPNHFENTELSNIPAGWEVWRVADIGNVICGKTPSTQEPEFYGHDVPFITIPDMHGKVFATTTQKQLSHAGAASQRRKMLPPGAICVSCIATPGLVVITSEEAQTNQQINTVIPNRENETYYWFWSLCHLGQEIRAGGSGGSVLTNLSTGRFSELRILAAPLGLRSFYHLQVGPLFARILVNDIESHTLAALRDTLLTKLISGELRVKDTEQYLKARGL